MYKKVNISELHLQVVALYTHGFDKAYYVREVARAVNVSPRTAHLLLKDLEKKRVLESRTRGKIKEYTLKKTEKAKEYLILAENWKRIAFLNKRDLIREAVEQISPGVKGIAMIFGSHVKELEREGSDIDIFIAGTYNEEKVRNFEDTFRVRLDIKRYPQKLFKKVMGTDILIRQVLKNHVIIKGSEELIEMVVKPQ